jgi:hypothetical protein
MTLNFMSLPLIKQQQAGHCDVYTERKGDSHKNVCVHGIFVCSVKGCIKILHFIKLISRNEIKWGQLHKGE